MTYELRPATDDEFARFARELEDAFGFHADDDNIADIRANTELDRTIGVFDGKDVVGTAGAYSFELTVPGGVGVRAAGVTFVTVRATHRRRGILRSIMTQQHDDIADRGEPLALLTASESLIYGRFGYGLGVLGSSWSIETAGAAFTQPPRTGGRLRLVDRAEAAQHVARIYDQRRRQIPGAVTRSEAWWTVWFKDRAHEREGASARWYLLHESATGEVDGFLAYRRRRNWEHGLPRDVLVIDQLYGLDDEIEAELYQYAFDKDLIHTVTASSRPVDEPIRWRLDDPRQLTTTDVVDRLWVRVIDVAAALSARHYSTEDHLVIEVNDPFRPQTSGRYLVEGATDGAACARTDADPDLTMDVRDLGAIYLGGVAPTALRRAGRIVEHTPGSVARADGFFVSSPSPWLTTGF